MFVCELEWWHRGRGAYELLAAKLVASRGTRLVIEGKIGVAIATVAIEVVRKDK